jgi:quercetin dioxygenase-like cupin family protein
MARLSTLAVVLAAANAAAQTPAGHDHGLTKCVDLQAGETRPAYGCWNIARERLLTFMEPSVYWHLRRFGTKAEADAAKGEKGLVVQEDGQVWLSTFGPRAAEPKAGEPVAIIGPLHLPPAKAYDIVLSYAVMQPGDKTPVHTHPGPEAWYVLAGQQCLDTSEGARRAGAGEGMSVPADVPMELHITGTVTRKSLVVVVHDSAQDRSIPSDWTPSGACGP